MTEPTGKLAGHIRRHQPVFVLAGLALGAFGARLASESGLPLPFCLLRKLTGIPCPACGCTRSLIAWTNFDLIAALRFNPLFFAGSVTLILWAGAWLTERLSGRPLCSRLELAAERAKPARVLIALVAINWLYLCLTLPK
jgi:hypothetical protein